MEFEMYKATVIDIDDVDKQGKIKIRILPQLEGLMEDELPWAIPFITTCAKGSLMNDLPEVGSTIRVLVDDKWKRFYYLANMYFYNLFDFNKVSSKLQNLENVNGDYKNLHFHMYKDGSLMFHNDDDGSNGFIHKNGSYQLFDKDGNNIMYVSLNSKFTMKNDMYSLGSILKELMNDLADLHTEGSPTNHTSPTLTTQMASLLPKLESLFDTED